MEAFHETRDLGAAPGIGGRGRAEQLGAHVPVAEAVERVFATEDRGEDGEVGRGQSRERRLTLTFGANGSYAHAPPTRRCARAGIV